ncbi:MAG TPA: hypothetical protein VK075_00285 [Pseudogracilibacillus sp.]|nr:hypothetical protein [Pseudogracilibacillus sp.]
MASVYAIGAAAFASIFILIFYTKTLHEIRDNPDSYNEIMTKHLLRIVVIEVIPIMLIVLAFINIDSSELIIQPMIGLIIVIAILLLNYIVIFMRYRLDIPQEQKAPYFTTFMLINIGFASAFPFIAIIILLMHF